MKKQIALIIVSMLAVMSVSAQKVNTKEECRHSQKSSICEEGAGVIQPSLDDIFGGCTHYPDVEVKPELPEEPVLPEIPELPEMPEMPEIPGAPEEIPDNETEDTEISLARQVFLLVNAERAKHGLSALTYDSTLERAADVRAAEIKKSFSHTRPDGKSCFTAIDETGYSYRTAGENIAYGQRSASEVMEAWMNSEGHRANILGQNYTNIGVGVFETGGVIYWSQFFAG